jgi:hypothetical protein
MSSTNRGAERIAEDAYMTPEWSVRRFLEAWKPPPPGLLVEPAVGAGAIVRAARACGLLRPWLTFDIRDVAGEVLDLNTDHHTCDFLALGPEHARDDVAAVITNPPYVLAEAFVRQCRSLYRMAEIVMLLRLNFLGSRERVPFWSAVGMPDLYQLPNRPDFTGDGGDSIEYSWFGWPAAVYEPSAVGTVRMLGLTSLEIRRGEKQGQLALGGPDGL